MKKVVLSLVISLLIFGGLAIAEEVKVPLEAVKSSCYGEIDMTKAEFTLSEVGKECVKDDWLEANLSQGSQQQQAENTEKEEKILEIFKLNASTNFDREAIKRWAEKNSWKEARNFVLDAHERKKTESVMKNKTVTLYTPIATWIENYYKAKQRFWSEEKRKEEYKEKVDYPDKGAYFLYGFTTGKKLELRAKDLRFVLEDNTDRHWIGENVRIRDEAKKNIMGVNVFFYTADVEFNFPEDKIPSWEKMTLYVIRTDLVGQRDEFTWNFEEKRSSSE